MIENALISYLGENKPNLISEITAYLTDAGGEFSGVTFATLGRVCDLTMVYKTGGKKNLEDLQNDLQKLSSVTDGQLQIKSLPNQSDSGPTSKITHRIVLSGDDKKGLLTSGKLTGKTTYNIGKNAYANIVSKEDASKKLISSLSQNLANIIMAMDFKRIISP